MTGKLRYVAARLRGLPRPPITVRPAPESEVVFERDVAVRMRDGTVLRVNVFRPPGESAHPALLCAHGGEPAARLLVPVIDRAYSTNW